MSDGCLFAEDGYVVTVVPGVVPGDVHSTCCQSLQLIGPLLDASAEFTAEVVASATGDFRFFAAPGTWTVRALSRAGNGDITVAPVGAGLVEVDVKVA